MRTQPQKLIRKCEAWNWVLLWKFQYDSTCTEIDMEMMIIISYIMNQVLIANDEC
jgi:hypothetical protein